MLSQIPLLTRQPVSLQKVKLCLLTQFRIRSQIQLFFTSFSRHFRVRELQFCLESDIFIFVSILFKFEHAGNWLLIRFFLALKIPTYRWFWSNKITFVEISLIWVPFPSVRWKYLESLFSCHEVVKSGTTNVQCYQKEIRPWQTWT